MATQDTCCSIVPYFTVHENRLDDFKVLCERFMAQVETEDKCIYYGFSFAGNLVHCREAYDDASGLLAHLENVGPILEDALQISDLTRLEIHGPAQELELLRQPLAALTPEYFVLEYGIRR